MKQIDPKIVKLSMAEFAIYPFGAMYAANLSAELGKFIGPVIVGILPAIAGGDEENGDAGGISIDLNKSMPLIGSAFASLDGDTLEVLLKKLLVNRGNVSCMYYDENGNMRQEGLKTELIDELFCQNVEELYRLAFEVINVNYSGFFTKFLTQSGSPEKTVMTLGA